MSDGFQSGGELVLPSSPAPKKTGDIYTVSHSGTGYASKQQADDVQYRPQQKLKTSPQRHGDFSSFRKRMESHRDGGDNISEQVSGTMIPERDSPDIGQTESVYKEIEGLVGLNVAGETRKQERRLKMEHKIEGASIQLRSGTLMTRFLGYCKVDVDTGCWIWKGEFEPKSGICHISFCNKDFNARRVAYELFCGHTQHWKNFRMDCDHHKCVNPAHMNAYGAYKQPYEKRPYKIKHRREHWKMTPQDVADVRASMLSKNELAEKYGVKPWYIWAVKTGRKGGPLPDREEVMAQGDDPITGRKLKDLQRIMGCASILVDLEEQVAAEQRMKLEAKLNGLVYGNEE